jgi:hypothetical protein
MFAALRTEIPGDRRSRMRFSAADQGAKLADLYASLLPATPAGAALP